MNDISPSSNTSTSDKQRAVLCLKGWFFSALLLISFSTAVAQEMVVSAIVIHGNQKTSDKILLRELPFNIDSSYQLNHLTENLLPQAKWNLMNLNLFNGIELRIEIDESRAVVHIEVVEKWYLWPIPFIEYADRNFNQWVNLQLDPYRTNYGLYLFQYNLFGMNQTLKLSLVNGYNREVGIQYSLPWLNNKKNVGLEIKSRYRVNSEIWYKTTGNEIRFLRDLDQNLIRRFENEFALMVRPGINVTHRPFAVHRSISIADTVNTSGVNPEFLSNQSTSQQELTIGYQWQKERRNNRFFPTSGHFLAIGAGQTFLQGGSDYPFINGHAAAYNWLDSNRSLKSFSLAVAGGFRWAFAKNLPYSHQRALGYDFALRGYESYVMDGHAFGYLKTEMRYLLITGKHLKWRYMPIKSYRLMPVDAYLSAFFDQGMAANNQTQQDNSFANQHQYGYGLGLNAVFYNDKVFRFEYSFNKQGEHGLKIHFNKAF